MHVLTDLDSIERDPSCSLHDLDLAMSLKLMKGAGMLDSVTIIGVPAGMGQIRALRGVKEALSRVLGPQR